MQPGLPTIQGALEEILGGMEGRPVHVAGSGRTDAGVHALAQVAAFTIDNPIPLPNLRRAINRLLPPAIRVLSAEEAARIFIRASTPRPRLTSIGFCAAKSAALSSGRMCTIIPYPLDEDRMVALAAVFAGEHDFTAFAASRRSRCRGPVQGADGVFVGAGARRGRLIYRIRGSGFLKHMVRNLVGTLIEAGKGNIADLDRAARTLRPHRPRQGAVPGERGIRSRHWAK